MKNLRAPEFMEKNPTAARPDMHLSEVVAMMCRRHVRALPVADDDGRLVGVVTETDLFLKEKGVPFSLEKVTTLLGEPVTDHLAGLEQCHRVTVAEVMTDHPVSIPPDTTLEDAAMLMHKRRLSVLPVVDGERLVGMVYRINLLQRIYSVEEAPV